VQHAFTNLSIVREAEQIRDTLNNAGHQMKTKMFTSKKHNRSAMFNKRKNSEVSINDTSQMVNEL